MKYLAIGLLLLVAACAKHHELASCQGPFTPLGAGVPGMPTSHPMPFAAK